MTDELKPCPFYGSEKISHSLCENWGRQDYWAIGGWNEADAQPSTPYLKATPAREAAPDMLEALEACEVFCDSEGMVNGVNVRAAIAKAKGAKHMTQKPDGGPAFPMPATDGLHIAQEGMSLRDWFAGQALAGLMAGRGGPIQKKFLPDEAALSFDYADAMIAARGEKTEEKREPLVTWVLFNDNGTPCGHFSSKAEAERAKWDSFRVVRMVEAPE